MRITRRPTFLAVLAGATVLGLTTSPATALRLAPEPAHQSETADALEPYSAAPTSPDARERWVAQVPATQAGEDAVADVHERYPWLSSLADYPGGTGFGPVALMTVDDGGPA